MSIYLFLLCASVLPETFLLCSKKQTLRFPPCFSLPHLIRIAVLVLCPSTRFQKETPALLSGQQRLEQGFLLSGLSPGTKGRNRSWTLKIMAMVDIIHMCPRDLVPPLPPTAGSFLVSSGPTAPTPPPPSPSSLCSGQISMSLLSGSGIFRACLNHNTVSLGQWLVLLSHIFINSTLLSRHHRCPSVGGSKETPGPLSPLYTPKCQVPSRSLGCGGVGVG